MANRPLPDERIPIPDANQPERDLVAPRLVDRRVRLCLDYKAVTSHAYERHGHRCPVVVDPQERLDCVRRRIVVVDPERRRHRSRRRVGAVGRRRLSDGDRPRLAMSDRRRW